MQPEDQVRLQHLADAAAKAIAYSTNKHRADLYDDELLRLALTKHLLVRQTLHQLAQLITLRS